MNALKFATGKWFWIMFSGMIGLVIIGSILFANNLIETSYQTEGVVIGKTIESHSSLFGGYSNEVCIVEYEGKKQLIEEFIYHYDKMTVLSAEIDTEARR